MKIEKVSKSRATFNDKAPNKSNVTPKSGEIDPRTGKTFKEILKIKRQLYANITDSSNNTEKSEFQNMMDEEEERER